MESAQTKTRTAKSKKELSQAAIALALQGEWEKAAELNQSILDITPGDVEAMNRLGKALMEVGDYQRAREVLGQVVVAAPYNNIAKKNLARLSQLEVTPVPAKGARKTGGAPQLFIADSGKSGTTVLQKPASGRVMASVAPGEPVSMALENNAINVYVRDDEYLGRIEPKLGRRLGRLMEGGNRYEAAVIGVNEKGVSVIIRESYRHPDLHNVCPFPTQSKEVYLSDNLLRYIEDADLDDEDGRQLASVADDDDGNSEWDE